MAQTNSSFAAQETMDPLHDQIARLTDKLSDALILIDKDWRITYANPTAQRNSFMSPGYINGDTLWNLYPGLIDTEVGQAYMNVARTGREHVIKGFYYAPFDTMFDLHVIPMDNGIAVHYRDVLTDVRDAEKDRDSKSKQLQQVLDTTTDGVLIVDRQWEICFVNRRARANLERSGELLGRKFWDSFPDAQYPGSPFVEHYERAMNKGVGASFEAFYPAPLNIWVDVSVRPSIDGIIIFFRDITQQKIREQQLRDSEERYRVLAELSPQSLWSASPDGRVLYANKRFLEYIGHDFVPATGTEYIACFDPEDRDRVVEVWNHSIATGEDYVIDARLLRAADGASRWWHLRALPVRDPDGHILQWLGTANDIHDIRATADQLREQIAQQKRAEAALIQSEKLAAVGRMASSIAHEINNPLESVMNLIYLARSYSVVPEVQSYLDLADQELRRVSIIANQTLRFHKQATNPREVTCGDLFTSVLTLYEGRLRNSGIEVERRNCAPRSIKCFEGDIRQVLSNLIGNAIDAMPQGGRLLLRSRPATDWRTGREGVTLTIADTGSGMSPETQAHVFDAFFTTKGFSGTGLGLWVSTEIMQRHNGRILMRSSTHQAHHGTIFSLFLPIIP